MALAADATDYNVLQNNGTIAHQQVHHVRHRPNAQHWRFWAIICRYCHCEHVSNIVHFTGSLSHGKDKGYVVSVTATVVSRPLTNDADVDTETEQ